MLVPTERDQELNSRVNKFSENGVSLLTGLGVADVRQQMMSAFACIREPLVTPAPPVEVVVVNAEERSIFRRHADGLMLAALASSHVMSEVTNGPIYVIPPNESAEELFKMLDDFNTY